MLVSFHPMHSDRVRSASMSGLIQKGTRAEIHAPARNRPCWIFFWKMHTERRTQVELTMKTEHDVCYVVVRCSYEILLFLALSTRMEKICVAGVWTDLSTPGSRLETVQRLREAPSKMCVFIVKKVARVNNINVACNRYLIYFCWFWKLTRRWPLFP